MFKYIIYNQVISDLHIIYLVNYKIEIEFFSLNFWTLAIKYYRDEYVTALYLPILDISIYSNK